MNSLFWKKVFDESNLLIIIPATVIVASLVWFLVFGLSSPDTTLINSSRAIVDLHQSYENGYLDSYSEDEYSQFNPFFILDPYKMAPLSGLLMFEAGSDTVFKVVIKGKTEEADFEYITEALTSHSIPIYGLYPGTRNIVELYELDGLGNYEMVNVVYVKTEQLPNSVILPLSIDTTYDYFKDNLMVTMSSNDNFPVGYDMFGDVRWYLSTK